MDTWITIIPPLIVIITAIYTKKVTTALVTGIISAALVVCKGNIFSAIKLIFTRTIQEADLDILFAQVNRPPDHLYTFGFLLLLGVVIELVNHTGGLSAYSTWLKKRLKTAKAGQVITIILSCFFFLDDYLECLTVGSIMKSITDSLKIPRVKLAYILNSVSSPICVLIPASSWVATVLTQLQVAGVSNESSSTSKIIVDSFFAYLHSMPFFIYPIVALISTLFIIIKPISFGPMQKQEEIAQKTGNLFGGKEPLNINKNINNNETQKGTQRGHMMDFLFPIGFFILMVIISILYFGNYKIGGPNNFIQILQSINMLKALFIANLVTVIASLIFAKIRKTLQFNKLGELLTGSWSLMQISLLVLMLAWVFSSLLKNDLGTGVYISQTLLAAMPNFLVPLMVFVTTLIVSASTGSAWGSIAVVVPLAIPLALQDIQSTPVLLNQVPLFGPILGALMSGAVAGGHVSSISDATLIAAISTNSYHMDHFLTQIAYVIPVVISCSIGFIIIGFTKQPTLALMISAFLSISSLWLINSVSGYLKKNSNSQS